MSAISSAVEAASNEAVTLAKQVQRRAAFIQEQSRAVPPRAPQEATKDLETARQQKTLLYMGGVAVVALTLAYMIMRNKD
jgi:hypothetical protein